MYGSSPGHSEDVLISVDDLAPMNNEARIPEGGFALLSTTPQNETLAHFISALAFDPFQELLWTGNNMGRVVSFYGAQLDKYTAFLSEANSSIRALLASETVIFSLTSKRLKANRRQGISLFTHTSDHMTDLTCMHRLSDVPHKLLLGGNQQQIIQFDVETQKEIRIVSVKQKNCLALRSNQKFLFSSDSEGNITLRHLTTVDAIHALQAHQGSVADFDVCGNKLITCGYSPRLGKITGDRFIMIYDLRTLRSLPPVPLPVAPSYCRFLPSYSDSRIMICSQNGELIVMDLNEQSSQIPIQLDTNGFAITSLDVSTSKQCISFGDQTGLIHLFSDRMEPIFNENSWGTDFPDPPDPISEKVIDSMRMVQFVGYAHNPRADTPLRGYNVCPYTSSTHDKCFSTAMKNDEVFHVPKFYLRTKGRLAFKDEETDFKRYNRTEFNALENSVETSPACMLLLAMYHLMNVRTVFLSHFCYLEGCISCEMNLLFRLLTDRPVSSMVSAKNFMKTFRSIDDGRKWADAAASARLAEAVHLFMQAFSKVLDKELSETTAGVALRKELEISFSLNNHCIRCSEYYQSALSQLYISLAYPSNNEKIGFCTLLEKTLNCPEQNEAICQKCGKLARFASTRRVRLLPNILTLDVTASTEAEQAFWISHIQAFESRTTMTSSSITEQKLKPCSKSETVTPTTDTTSNPEYSHYIPDSVHIKISDGICTNKMENTTSFHLAAAVFVITQSEGNETEEHLVTAIKTKQDSCWILFNDCSVTRISENEALHLHGSWKLPAVLYYMQSKGNGGKEVAKDENRAIIPRSVFWNDLDSNKIKIPERGSEVAIYAKYTVSESGEKLVSEVSAVNEDGSCFMSSVIKEPEVKSDMENSQTPKRVSLKLLYLIQEKMTIVGYKIENLFEMLNIHVPKEQVKDIVSLYRSLFKRSLSLNALAQHFFGESVEEEETDPIDLARLSLRLHAKFKELKEADEADVSITTLTQIKLQQKLYASTISNEGVVSRDRLRLFIRAGSGGQGLQRFNGTGGNGGDVIMVGDSRMTFEAMIKNAKHGVLRVQSQSGMNSSRTSLIGTNGKPKILKVPIGVDVINAETKLLIARCSRPSYNYVIARGGRGGCAENCFHATAGERFFVDLHLKLHPNIGLVGFPNAGKSTVMKALVPKRTIKIANYPFTTVKPQIGYISDFGSESTESDDDDDNSFSLSIADLPGLIEGAAMNRGRGREFLKHLEFSDILLMVVDVLGFKLDLSVSNPYRNALETVALLNIELEKYDPALAMKPTIIALNKIDLPNGEEKAKELVSILEKKNWSEALPEEMVPARPLSIKAVIPIAAKDRRLGDLKNQLKFLYARMHPLSAPNFCSAKKTVLS
ncbi:unnamed protein product [Litomosoides sigmodontis]|uniref:USP domain-containing protein n=1 Tax=Litomosoides sigmodontis TaxID=42156 RepID=A0A3P6SVU7_LITSI|nr:unnamed protein product [Litomosoides sigmodontis]